MKEFIDNLAPFLLLVVLIIMAWRYFKGRNNSEDTADYDHRPDPSGDHELHDSKRADNEFINGNSGRDDNDYPGD